MITNKELIERLYAIKKSIVVNASDVLWMHGAMNTTVCEEIDGLLLKLGENEEAIEAGYMIDLDECQVAEAKVKLGTASEPKPFNYANGDHLKTGIENEERMRARNGSK